MPVPTQKILKGWKICGSEIPHSSTYIYICISEDRKYWSGHDVTLPEGMGYIEGEDKDFFCFINKRHLCEEWEKVRQYLINTLIPELSILEPVETNELDRFSSLEE